MTDTRSRPAEQATSPMRSDPEPVLLNAATATPAGLSELLSEARIVRHDLDDAVAFVRSGLVHRVTRPGEGATSRLWEVLATLGSIDLSVARVAEPHLDAMAILAEADVAHPVDETFWGVYAAEAPEHRLLASSRGGRWRLDGSKPWCSLADRVTHALVTAWVDAERRQLFAVDMRQAGIHPRSGPWVARGLSSITSGPVSFSGADAQPVGEPGWYLRRNGFAWGGIGVAAVWYGGAVAIARRILAQAGRREPDQIALMHLGVVDTALAESRCMLAAAAQAVDEGSAAGRDGELLALRVRGTVASTVERVLQHADHALGPAPLTQEEEYARRVSDLRVYVRQHHAERDAAALGDAVMQRAHIAAPW